MNPIAERFRAWYESLSPALRRKTLVYGGLAMALLAGGLAFMLQARWAVLYSNLDEKDASAVVEKLKENKVPYRLGKGGAEIMVPEDSVYDQRLALAAAGLPRGTGQGYELLDKGNTFGLSEETARTNGLRALQGELERTILTLGGVEGVRVHLVVPERKLFAQERPSATASVVLKLRPGTQLSDEQAAGIVHLISHAVEGLAPSGVALLDTQGRQLADFAAAGGMGVSSQVDSQRKVERHLRDKAQSLLDEALGAGEAIVRVSADIDFNSGTISREIFSPAGGAAGLIREQVSSSSQSGGGQAAGAAPAAVKAPSLAGNGENPVAGPAGEGRGGRANQSTTRYELNRTVENFTQGAGSLKRLSVTVLLKNQVPAAAAATLRQAVADSVGLDPKRGDSLSLAATPLSRTAAAEVDLAAMSEQAGTERWFALARTLAPWTAIVVVALLGFVFLGRAVKTAFENFGAGPAPASGEGYTGLGYSVGGNGHNGNGNGHGRLSEQEILEMARRNPASAANVLRRMIN